LTDNTENYLNHQITMFTEMHKNKNIQRTWCEIVPSEFFKRYAETGTEQQKQAALKNIEVAEGARGRREIAGKMFGMFLSEGRKSRTIYNANNSEFPLPGSLARKEGDGDSSDKCVNTAYENSGIVYDFYYKICNRKSIDNNYMGLRSVVHYGNQIDNAFWDGKYMLLGDGGEVFKSLCYDLTVMGHEMTHGVIDYEAALEYRYQSGALNESFADIAGIVIDQWIHNQRISESTWLIGKDLFKTGGSLRSLKDPGTANNWDQQPAHMDNYVNTDIDRGGVHINSGIPNKAFYEVCMRSGLGYAWEGPFQIFYHAVCDELRETANFQDAADATFNTAKTLYPSTNLPEIVISGWKAVGIDVNQG
jgi:Zn-dependent metalloprotease